MSKKSGMYEEDYYYEELVDEEEYLEELEEKTFICRNCNKEFDERMGDDFILICDNCASNFNMAKIWNDYVLGIILEEELDNFDLDKYRLLIM
ncbi:MAG: hypothetical protein GY870_00985 [archaeon]|nr:hypothetical protein [archaeon]